MSLWTWAERAYARPGVAEACLRLQDEHGQNVCLLLWAVWAEARDEALLGRAVAAARAWEAAAVLPLRSLRRGLKAPVPPVADAPREALRQMVKAAELAAERVLLESLEALGGERKAGAPALEALQAAALAWDGTRPDAALAALAAAFE